MSPRAACRLETLRFERVYDYVAGKVDYLARGLEREGAKVGEPRVGDFARDDVVTCRLQERIAEVRPRIDASPYGFAFVTSPSGILLGRLRRSACEEDLERPAEEAMESGPSTVRPDEVPQKLRERLEKRDLKTAVVTTPEGALIGVVLAADLPAADEASG